MIPALLLLFASSPADRLVDAALSAGAESHYKAVAGCTSAPAFQNVPHWALADRSFICRSESSGVSVERHFYVTRNGTLGQYVHAWVSSGDAAFAESIRAVLSKRYGKPRPVRDVGEIGVYGRPAERWSTDHAQLILHTQPYRRDVWHEGVQLIGISHERWQMTLEDETSSHPSNELLKKALPKYTELFDGYEPKSFDATLAAAREVLSEVRNAKPERAALLLVAGDVLADRLAGMGADIKTDRADIVRRTLAPFGIRIGEPTHYAGLEYRWEPLWRAAREYSGTDWGQIAFVRLLHLRWPEGETTGSICPRADVFARVIENGDKWLATHPDSKHRPEVLYLVAQAYETWWSVVRAPKDDIRVHDQFGPVRAKYVKGAPNALAKAVAYYDELLRLAPESKEARQAERRLPRLRRGFDTGQRAFLCTFC